MGNRISTTPEPVIMTETFLKEKVVQNTISVQELDVSEFQKLVEMDGLECDFVYSLNLEHQNLVNVDELWRFKFLTKLELPNNYLEKIEGLGDLINLQYLDLSFNFIKHICNLEKLTNLNTLCLTSNEITVLQNMESLKKLETFLIRDNKIESFDCIYYLEQFHNLSSVAVDKNPFMQEMNVKLHIIAVLPHLKYLDFLPVTLNQIQQASSKFPLESNRISPTKQISKEKFTCGFLHSDKEAFVEGLANGQGFQSFVLSDKNFQLLSCSSLAAEIYQDFSSKITKLFDEWHEFGHKYYEEIQHEKSQFLMMVSKAEQFSTKVLQEEELKFIDFKENIPRVLCYIYHSIDTDDEKVIKIAELRKVCEHYFQKTFRNFMNCGCLYIDLTTNMCKIYEKEVSGINEKYVQEVSKFSYDILNLNTSFSEKLQQLYIDIHNSGLDLLKHLNLNEKEPVADDLALLQLIKNKELIETTLKLSVRIHSTLLQERINHLKVYLQRNLSETLHQVSEKAFSRQNEFARNTVIFFNKQKYFIEKLFSKNNIFENYFGYHKNLH